MLTSQALYWVIVQNGSLHVRLIMWFSLCVLPFQSWNSRWLAPSGGDKLSNLFAKLWSRAVICWNVPNTSLFLFFLNSASRAKFTKWCWFFFFHASHRFYRFVFPFHTSLSDGVIRTFKSKQINWRLYSQFSLLHFHFCGSHQVGSNHVRHLVLHFDVTWHISVFLIYSRTNPSIQQSILPALKTPPTVPQHSS